MFYIFLQQVYMVTIMTHPEGYYEQPSSNAGIIIAITVVLLLLFRGGIAA